MRLASLTRPELIFPELRGSDAVTVLRSIADRMAELGVVRDAEELHRRLWEREKLGSTGIGAGVAIPHCKVRRLDQVVVAVGLCPRGVDFGACDGKPVKLFFTLVSPTRSPAEHLQSLAAISKWVKADRHVERILKRRDPQAIFDLLAEDGVDPENGS